MIKICWSCWQSLMGFRGVFAKLKNILCDFNGVFVEQISDKDN